ncbi:Cna B-type domain-containing protein [Staphylococcus aureus]|uniref:Cna B-type domain-containing protein n=1 Tax=Staphylococcus aureus TaxID=1280 RepID=UPI001AAD9A3E|nr:Cna B-type domain-containing protein [Staphylococcus aureus]MBO2757537.1 Cna B-type domain-containing protein [Staphylococcus aureus]
MNKNVLKFMVFIMLLNIITPLFNKNDAFAARDISSTNVTDLTVSPSKIEDGGKTTVKMTFDDKNGKIQNGDTIKVAWPTSGTVKIEGYSKTVPLTVKGEQVGQAVITPDGATITFNDKVEKLSDVSGFAEFEVQGRNLTQTNTSDDKVATITSGNKSTNVTVHKSEAGTSSVFYYKTGDMLPEDTTHVRWFLNINNEKRYVSKDITIKDQIQGGQQLDLSTLNINVTGTHSNYYSGSNAITDFEKAFPGSKITVDNTKNTIDVTIPQGYGSYNSFSINYKTKITNEQQKEFVNNSQAWYQEHGKEEVNGKSFNHTVHNINANAGIEGTVKGELKVLKQDKDTKAPIANVKFKLSKKDGSVVKDNQKEIEIITDANGIANIKALPSGDYILKEIEAPAPYTFDKDKEYPFTMKDTDNQGYFTTIENAKAIEKTKDVSAQKVWEGSQKVKPTIYFKLYKQDDNQNTTPVDKAEIKKLEDGTTKVTWSNLPENDKNGKAIKYLVKEVNAQGEDTTPEGYTKKENGLVVTNTEKPIETTSISGEKVWDDKDNQDGKRPEKVSVNLLANGEKVKTVDVTSETNWKYEFKNLPKYDEGKKIEYTVTEDHVKDYTETTSISGEKVWDDKDNQDGKRPEKVSVNLLANGEKVKTVDVTSETNWKYEFKNLPKYDEGKKIEYTVTEDHVKDYTTDINGTTITNKYTPGETSATVTKNWDDNNNQDGKRPTEIKVELYQDGKATGKTATLNESNNWTHTWAGLDEKAKGQQVKYTVEELTKVKGYTTHVDNNDMGNLIVTNKYTPETTSISGEKVWDDKDNQDGKRPEKVSVNLLANGEKVETVDVTSETNWKYEFKNLPKYDEGKKIEYTVTEDHVKDYTTDINGTTITNKYTPGETSATVTKNWDDNNNQDGKRPTEIKVELYQDGKATGKTATLNESNNWTHTWAGLDEKAKGQQVKYTVEELTKVKGYTTHVDNNDIGNLIVTNKYTPEKPNKPIYPEKPKDKTPPTKPDHSNKVKPTPPDKPSKVDKADQSKDNKTKPENPLKELPKTGMKIITSWITWVFIGILGLYLILRKRFNS